MYTKGDLAIRVGSCDCSDRECDEHWEKTKTIFDARGSGKTEGPIAYLDHSCDEWVIGGVQEIEWLISDLWEAIRKLKGEE